jgi:hypothetical protein
VTAIYLLDASVLIPLIAGQHVHHRSATEWATRVDRFAVCPVVEGALVRFMVRLGASARDGQGVLKAVQTRRGYEFWPDDVSYADLELAHVQGHRQVTDAYLVGLAKARSARLATFDQALAEAFPANTTVLRSS